MKIRKRLSQEEAKKLGLEIKPNEKGRNTARYMVEVSNDSDTQDYEDNVLSAWGGGRLLTVDEWCEKHSIPADTIHSAKLITHTGTPYYNVVFKDDSEPSIEDLEDVKRRIATELNGISWFDVKTHHQRNKEAVVIISDIHLGAYIDGLIKTPDFSIQTIVDAFTQIVKEINGLKYKLVHVHILGDLIESFTGLNHKNSWKGLGKGMFGADVIKLCTEILHKSLLSLIHNLGTIKIVSGNHDRVTSNKDEDTGGDAANLIAWGLKMLNYDIEFNSFVISHEVDGICHILTHGHHGISKRTTSDVIWKYGDQSKYNLICEGHLHSRIQKHTVKQIDRVTDDQINYRKIIVPSIFTGNAYSEELGFTSSSGFLIVESNDNGKPNIFDISL